MQENLAHAIQNLLRSQDYPAVDFVVEHPQELSHGDFATNVALVLAKQVGKSPREVATELVTAWEAAPLAGIKEVAIAGPGFINFHLADSFFVETLKNISEHPKAWGRHQAYQDQLVLVEYTSPNLFKPLHVGNLVGNIIGESLTRLFEWSGATVKRINYPSDIGLPVAKAVWGIQQTGGSIDDINDLGTAYRVGNQAYEESESAKEEIIAVNQALYKHSDPYLAELRFRGITTSLRQFVQICQKLGTSFDTTITESESAPLGKAFVEAHYGTVFTDSDGAVVYDEARSGLHTRVFLNSKGLPTYEAKDLGNFAKKNELYPDWDTSVVVTGSEQREYFKVIYAAIHEVFPEAETKALEHISTGFLTLSTGKMSSRLGNVLTGESLLADMEAAAAERVQERAAANPALAEAVAVAALKYQILRQAVGSDIVFDKEKSLSFEGASGPYLQYTYARIQSVLAKASSLQLVASLTVPPAAPYAVEKYLYRFPEVTAAALAARSPHLLVTFLTELAGQFNSFYAQEPIATLEDELAPYKLALASAVGETLKTGLHLLGIRAPEKM